MYYTPGWIFLAPLGYRGQAMPGSESERLFLALQWQPDCFSPHRPSHRKSWLYHCRCRYTQTLQWGKYMVTCSSVCGSKDVVVYGFNILEGSKGLSIAVDAIGAEFQLKYPFTAFAKKKDFTCLCWCMPLCEFPQQDLPNFVVVVHRFLHALGAVQPVSLSLNQQ